MALELIDYNGALERLGDDPEFLVELLGEMIIQLDTDLPTLETAITEENFDAVHRLAHGLKGASANLNLTRFFHLFKELEAQGNSHQLNEAQNLFSQIKDTADELKTYVQNL